MPRIACLLAAVLALSAGACGGGDDDDTADHGGVTTRTAPPAAEVTTAPKVPSGEPTPTDLALPDVVGADRGRLLVAQTGCLACHRFGEEGNDAPGPDLTAVGQRMPASAIRRTLVEPTQPRPSFRDLPGEDLDALVEYLAGLGR